MRHLVPPVLLAAGVVIATSTVVGCRSGDDPDQVAGYAETARPYDAALDAPPAAISTQTRLAAAQLAETQGRLDEAAAQYREVLKAEPDHVDALFRLAAVHTMRRDFAQAIPAWERYTKVTGDAAVGWNNLGKCHEMAGRWREAEVSFLRALERDPANRLARVNYGLLLARRDRADEAEDQLSRVLPPAVVQYNLGSAAELSGDAEAARQRYARAIELDPHLREARQRLQGLDLRAAPLSDAR